MSDKPTFEDVYAPLPNPWLSPEEADRFIELVCDASPFVEELDVSDKSIVYLAVPYSHPDLIVRQARFQTANICAAHLMRQGMHVFSPISHTHPIALAGQLPLGFDYWGAFDMAFLSVAKRIIVVTVDGWKESVGVTKEIAIADGLGLPISFMCTGCFDLRSHPCGCAGPPA